MCRYEKIQRGASHGGGYSAMREGPAHGPRNFAVRNDLAEGEFGNRTPDVVLEYCSRKMKRKIEAPEAVSEVSPYLGARFSQQRISRLSRRATGAKITRYDRPTVALQAQRANGCPKNCSLVHGRSLRGEVAGACARRRCRSQPPSSVKP